MSAESNHIFPLVVANVMSQNENSEKPTGNSIFKGSIFKVIELRNFSWACR